MDSGIYTLHFPVLFAMHFLHFTAVLSLLTVSTAVPLPCEDVVRPLVLGNLSLISGKWILIEGTVDDAKYAAAFKPVTSAWVEIVPTIQNDTGIFTKAYRMNGFCSYLPTNFTLSNSTIQFAWEEDVTGNSTATFLQSCADCLVMKWVLFLGDHRITVLHMFRRTGKLSDFDRETFRRQLECVGLGQPGWSYDEQQELCPGKERKSHKKESPEGKPEQDKSD